MSTMFTINTVKNFILEIVKLPSTQVFYSNISIGNNLNGKHQSAENFADCYIINAEIFKNCYS